MKLIFKVAMIVISIIAWVIFAVMQFGQVWQSDYSGTLFTAIVLMAGTVAIGVVIGLFIVWLLFDEEDSCKF